MRADLKRLKREIDSGRSSAISTAAPAMTPPSGSAPVVAQPSSPALQPASAVSGPASSATDLRADPTRGSGSGVLVATLPAVTQSAPARKYWVTATAVLFVAVV